MALTAEPVTAERAESWGLIWKCVDDAALQAETRRIAGQLAAGATKAYGLIKKALYASSQNNAERQLALEAELQREAARTADFREGVSAFLEKRPARFSGR